MLSKSETELTREYLAMLEKFGLEFHHFGLAVKEPSQATKFLEGLGYKQERSVFDQLQNVNFILCNHENMPAVEIIYPASAGVAPVDNLLARRPEGIIYHLCYISRDLEDSLKRMGKSGLTVREVVAPIPASFFADNFISFHMIAGVGLIEIISKNDSLKEA